MSTIKSTALLFLSVFTFTAFSQDRIIIDSDDAHKITYKVFGDSIKIYVEVLNDFTIDLNSDGTLGDDDDFVYLMFDFNSNNFIDFGANQIDLFYTYDTTQTNSLCNGHVTSPNNITSCEANSGGFAKVELKSSTYEATNHVYYTFVIPKQELDLNNQSLCSRLSVKIHTAGTSIANSVTFPTQGALDDYFVNPYNSILLYPQVDLGEGFSACVGDTLYANAEYPKYFWNTLSQEPYTVVVNYMEEYIFLITDGADVSCKITDTVKVNVLDTESCTGTFRFPNVVTPNSDGINDSFKPIMANSLLNQNSVFWLDSELKIYNRWGVFVGRTENAFPEWDVRSETGDYFPAGTYYYTFLTPSDNKLRVNGFFTVIHSE